MTKYDKHASHLQKPQKDVELADIVNSNAVVDPRAMMIVPVDAL